MSYNEQYISNAQSIEDLINILKTDVPEYADIEINGSSIIEVWYDDSTNTVILK